VAEPYLNFYNAKNIASGLTTSSTEFTGVIPFYGIAIDTDNSNAESYKPSARILSKFTDCTESALAGQMFFEVAKAGASHWSQGDPNPKNVMVLEPGTVTIGVGGTDNALDLTDLAVNGDASVSGDLVVTGDLTVNGTETVINSTTLSVDDKNIVLGSVATPTDTTADGGGITLKGTTDKTLNWVDSTDSWTSSEHLELASGKTFRINANEVLNQTTLGSTVVASSLTSVGTIGTGVWNGTAIADTYISSAATWNAKQAALSFGIADTNSIVVDGTPSSGEFAQFTSTGLVSRTDAQVLSDIGGQGALTFGKVSGNALKSEEALVTNDVLLMGTTDVKGRTYAELKTDLSLNNVENSAISTFAGSSNIVTTGALDTGSITSGFTSIDIGTGDLTAGAITGDSFQGSQLALIIGSGTVASINKATHSGRKLVYNGATASAWTLDDCPAADVGVTYTLVNAGTSTVTITRNTNSVFSRLVLGADPLTAGSISISKGGIIEIVCTAENVYSCFGSGIQ